MVGIAVATMVISTAAVNVAIMQAASTSRRRGWTATTSDTKVPPAREMD